MGDIQKWVRTKVVGEMGMGQKWDADRGWSTSSTQKWGGAKVAYWYGMEHQ